MKQFVYLFQKIPSLLIILLVMCVTPAMSQNMVTVKGRVVDAKSTPMIGATVVSKGNSSIGAVTDLDGNFTLKVAEGTPLVVSFLGMTTQEVAAKGGSPLQITMENSGAQKLDEIVVVGYGQQKKASVVGAITQTTGDVLKRAAAGISDVGNALTGNLPGVVTTASTGMPGAEDPQIVIRGSSSWNNSSPLVLVDGIERPMSSVDVSSIQYVSVLKDASATAVYGVKGANGVILITTKRGQEGRAEINVTANATLKAPSYLPSKLDSYDALMARNIAIEHELGLSPNSWDFVTPQQTINKYRNQLTIAQKERYPNVDWQKELFKDFTMSYNANVNVSGGNKVVKYFASADYVHEGDIFKSWDNGRGYQSKYGFDRLNVRSNLDFNITRTTILKMNLAGSAGTQTTPWANSMNDWEIAQQWAGVYGVAPDAFLPQYSDGTWGYYPADMNIRNSASTFALGGVMKTLTTRVNTDFVLQQDLKFITKGLNFQGSVAWDNVFIEGNRGVNDQEHPAQMKWINPETGEATYLYAYDTATGFDYNPGNLWTTQPGQIQNWNTQRQLNYQMQLNWARTYNKHSVSAMGLFSRQEFAWGSQIPNYREDWAFRTTYSYDNRYFFEYNGAYNGSEKFGPENRFAFFNSGALGWMISEEKFMENIKWLDMFKMRFSYGEIGDDSVSDRWLYMDQWAYGGVDYGVNSTPFYAGQWDNTEYSPYTWYRESVLGNPAVHWETVKKYNIGFDYSFCHGLFAGTAELFRDNRDNILISGDENNVPAYLGMKAPTENLGKVRTQGYEVELRFNKPINKDMRVWANLNVTKARNKVLKKADPALLPSYQKEEGFSMGQTHTHVDAGFCGTYDELYGSPQHDVSNNQKLPGDYYIIDYNADGVIDRNDSVPYGFSGTPENTYSASFGYEWKGLSLYMQFYGVTNVSRVVPLNSFEANTNNVYDIGSWWATDGAAADITTPRWGTAPSYNDGTQHIYDGSYIRLKNVELSYTFKSSSLSKIGFKSLRVYLNGNNLWVWSRMPDDRESNFAGDAQFGAYPTMRRVTLGANFTL